MNHSGRRLKFILRRCLHAAPVIFGIVIVNFLLLQLMEGDAVDALAGEAASATPEYMEQLRAKFGLDQPAHVQLLVYVKNILALDLGYSFRHEMTVLDLIMTRFWPTLLLMVSTLVIAIGMGIVLGLLGAMGLNTWRDTALSLFYMALFTRLVRASMLEQTGWTT